MSTAMIDEEILKRLLKSALVEVLEERRDLVQDIVEEALEDFGLSLAIGQGLGGPSVSRKQVLSILGAQRREG